jgi:hypothetical protein
MRVVTDWKKLLVLLVTNEEGGPDSKHEGILDLMLNQCYDTSSDTSQELLDKRYRVNCFTIP